MEDEKYKLYYKIYDNLNTNLEQPKNDESSMLAMKNKHFLAKNDKTFKSTLVNQSITSKLDQSNTNITRNYSKNFNEILQKNYPSTTRNTNIKTIDFSKNSVGQNVSRHITEKSERSKRQINESSVSYSKNCDEYREKFRSTKDSFYHTNRFSKTSQKKKSRLEFFL